MDKDLRVLLEKRGLPPTASDDEAKAWFDALPLDERGKIGTEMGQRGWEKSERPDQDVTTRAVADDIQRRDLTTRAFTLRAESIDDDTRSVEAVIATDAPVTVYDWRSGDIIDEVLRMDGATFPDQVPMLANHSRYSLNDVYGSVRGITSKAHEATGRLHFATDEDSERAWQKTRDGHLRDVSAGYRTEKYTDIRPGQSAIVEGKTYKAGARTLRVSTRWTLREVSLVPIGADARSKIRADNQAEERKMNKQLREYLESIGLRAEADEAEAVAFLGGLEGDQKKRAEEIKGGKKDAPADPPKPTEAKRTDPPAEPVDADAIARRAIADERARVRGLTELAGDDVPPEVLRAAIDDGSSVDQASGAFLQAIRERGPTGPAVHSRSHDKDCNVRSLAAGFLTTDGLDPTKCTMHNGRAEPRKADRLTEQDAERGDSLRGMSTYDLIRECILLDTGKHVRTMSEAVDMLRATPSGTSLSYVFTTNVYARLLQGWEKIGDTTTGWCDEEDVANFLTQEDISLYGNATLERLPRGDTAKHATATDAREQYKIARYAKQFVVDEQDLIDDRLGAIMRMPMEMGEAARQLRPDLVYSLMIENPTMGDTGAVFNSTAVTTAGGHANLGTAALASAALKTAITAMVSQRLNRTSTNPGQQLNVRPRFLVVPAALEWTARELTASAALAKLFADSSDPWYAMLNLIAQEGLRVIVDDRIGAIGVYDPKNKTARTGVDTNWFLFEGGSRGLRVAYRRGTNRQPSMRSFTLDRGQWGLGWDINLDIGAVFTEWRTVYKSTGAA